MNTVQMAGVSHESSNVAERERFSFTTAQTEECLCAIKGRADEAVLLSTCNRTELWVRSRTPDMARRLLTEARGEGNMETRTGERAVQHLYQVAAGLRSQVPLEDQILGQVKRAAAAAAQAGTSGPVMSQLFKGAITAGKCVRTEVKKRPRGSSIAQLAVSCAASRMELEGKKALIIGSGEIGRVCGEMLQRAGCTVFMTRRNLKPDGTQPPEFARVVDYQDRYEAAKICELVVSATASPHYTISADMMPSGHRIVLDLAIPRDVDPMITARGAVLLNIDDLGKSPVDCGLSSQIQNILSAHTARFYQWHRLRECIPYVEDVRRFVEEQMMAAAHDMTGAQTERVRDISRRTVDRLLFSLKDKVGMDAAERCYHALSQAAQG